MRHLKTVQFQSRGIHVSPEYIGETLERKLRRVTQTGEAIESISPIIHTERSAGVLPEHNIRHDRWEIAQDAMEKVYQQQVIKRNDRGKTEGAGGNETPTTNVE